MKNDPQKQNKFDLFIAFESLSHPQDKEPLITKMGGNNPGGNFLSVNFPEESFTEPSCMTFSVSFVTKLMDFSI